MLLLSSDIHVPLVATNDSHYLEACDHDFHDLLLCVGTAATLKDPNRFKFAGDQFYLKSPAEMRETFKDIPQACDNTLAIAARININLEPDGFHIPEYPIPVEKQTDADGKTVTPVAYLRKLALGGLRKRYGNERIATDPALRERLDYELGIIEKMGFSSYFLIVWDFIKYARDNDIPVGPGRGSAVGSIVSYCLAITALDPIRYGLYFERFLNPSRVSMPDIDTDFCIEGRERVIRYVIEKYGADRVAGIVTFGRMLARGSVRDAARVLEIPLPVVDKLAKLIPSGPKGMSVKQARKEVPELVAIEKQDPTIHKLMEMAERIEGFVRSTGTHAAGIVIADAPLTNYLPMIMLTDESDGSKTINTQFEMGWIEELGLIKMDFLGLRNLTLMRAAEKEIQRTMNPDFVLATIPDDDKPTYEMLTRGETAGVFQLESDGMRNMLVKMKPDRIEDIIAAVALYRPGPMDWIPQYISNKHGHTTATYLHPKLEPILAETNGIACYQEQVMEIAKSIAGYTMAEADNLRKVMGKKQTEKVAKEGVKFVEHAVQNGIAENIARDIFAFVEPFAGYGFNKSHAAAYGWISYQTAYLKANYPLQYLAALMSSIDNTEKLVEYIEETRQRKIDVLPPDVNLSQTDFAVVLGAIRFGFGAIKGLSSSSVEGIIDEREANGPFESIFDLVTRTRPRGVAKKTVENLIKVGACDGIDGHRAQQIAALDHAFDRANLDIKDELAGQLNFFGGIDEIIEQPKLPNTPTATRTAELNWEREGLGIYVSGHPVDAAQNLLNRRKAITISAAKKLDAGNSAVVGGMVGSIRRITTKAGKQMMITSIEDRTGSIEVVIFPNQYDNYHEVFIEGAIVAVGAQVKSKQRMVTDDEPEDEVSEKNLILNHVEEIAPMGWEPLKPQVAMV
jgi:DNA polymerase-3 subunit alpha